MPCRTSANCVEIMGYPENIPLKPEIYHDTNYSGSMAQCKTATTPLLTHWSYSSIALKHRFVLKESRVTLYLPISFYMLSLYLNIILAWYSHKGSAGNGWFAEITSTEICKKMTIHHLADKMMSYYQMSMGIIMDYLSRSILCGIRPGQRPVTFGISILSGHQPLYSDHHH